jgi:Xaa-Pro aminopeptidase
MMRKTILAQIQKDLTNRNIAVYLLPKTDPHRTEYTLDSDNLLQHLTGFSGSVGFAAISQTAAAVFVDGRYTVQIKGEVDPELFSYENYSLQDISNWIKTHAKAGDQVAYDPLLLSITEYENLKALLQPLHIALISLQENSVAQTWQERPAEFIPTLQPHPQDYTGMAVKQKLRLIQEKIVQADCPGGCHGLFLNTPESIAWLFNIRAKDRPTTPAASLYAYIPATGKSNLYLHASQYSSDLANHLGHLVDFHAYDKAFEQLASFSAARAVWVDPQDATMHAKEIIEQAKGSVYLRQDPCALPRACKNPTELQGARQAHFRDGIALCRFLHWLEETSKQRPLTELETVEKLYEFRRADPHYQGVSFNAIAGAGAHGAIVHYRATPQTDATLKTEEIFLSDSGGQYLEGTTDVTRPILLSKQPTAEQKDRFTRVLKGHIALSAAKFPEGTTGSQLDVLARQYLWQIGCDYAHGTGHGVGSYLGVHEGPQRISPFPNTVPLVPGMILSNEPGYYKEGEYGIRIENLIAVRRCDHQDAYEKNMLEFENLTLVPIEQSLIETALLTTIEIEWINQYHHQVYTTLQASLEPEVRAWLATATAPLKIN